MSNIKNFFLQFSHYFMGNAAHFVFGFITLPILTRLLSEDQYGILGLVTNTMALAVVFAKAGLSDGIIRMYREYSKTPEQRDVFSSTIIIRGLFLSILVVILYVIILSFIMPQVGISYKYSSCFLIMALYLFIRPLNIIVHNMLRVNEKTLFYNGISFFGKFISVCLSLFLLIYIIKDLNGYFVGIVLAEYLCSIILAVWFFSNYKVYFSKVSKTLSLRLIIFGVPLLISEAFYLMLSYFDRYLIVYFCGEQSLGVYTVGYNLAMYLGNLITFPLNYAIIPLYVKIFEEEGKEKTEKFLNQSLNYLMIAIIPVCIGYHAIAKDLIVFLASDKYASSAGFTSIILLGTIILGLNSLFYAGLYLKKRTTTIFMIMGAAVLVNICMNIVMLPLFGIRGAAITSLVSSSFLALVTIIISFRYIKIRISILNILYYIAWSILMYAVIIHISHTSIVISLIMKICLGALIVSSGILIREKKIRSRLYATIMNRIS